MKKIILSSILVTILAVAVAAIIMLYFKDKHKDQQAQIDSSPYYVEHHSEMEGGIDYDDGCPDCSYDDSYETPTLYDYHSEIVIDDENIGQAASFASEIFICPSFPIIGGTWYSISNGSPSDLEYTINFHYNYRNNVSGKVFMSLFVELYKNRAEYLSNGKFQHYVKQLAGIIPRKTYVDNGWDKMVRQLLIAYSDLAANPGSFSKIYRIMSADKKHPAYYYDDIRKFVSDERIADFLFTSNEYIYSAGDVNTPAVVWAYSFWGRRHNENPDSVEPIVAILRLLRDELYASP